MGCVFADKGPVAFATNNTLEELLGMLGIMNSTMFAELIKLQLAAADAAARSYDVGIIQRTPFPKINLQNCIRLQESTQFAFLNKRELDTIEETSHAFIIPASFQAKELTLQDKYEDWTRNSVETERKLSDTQRQIDTMVFELYGLGKSDLQIKTGQNGNNFAVDEDDEIEPPTSPNSMTIDKLVTEMLSYVVGCTVGRWDIRIAKNMSLAPKLQDPFDPLPVCSPGALVGPDGLPAIRGTIVSEEWLRARPNAISLPPEDSVKQPTIPDEAYPLAVDWDGILVDDPDHPDDIIRRVRDVLEFLWVERAEAIEQEACDILGVKELRDYFRKPGKGGFWDDHVKRYSKSRRKAPIYWLLQSAKKNYALWLYYHRLDKDMLFKALVNYVEPKLRLEAGRLEQLRQQGLAAGTSGREAGQQARQLEKELDHQDDFVAELHDFEEKLRRAANLNLTPDLNDGVVLNIAPLWELVPWKEARKYWEQLLEGKYEWSSIEEQLRSKGMVK